MLTRDSEEAEERGNITEKLKGGFRVLWLQAVGVGIVHDSNQLCELTFSGSEYKEIEAGPQRGPGCRGGG